MSKSGFSILNFAVSLDEIVVCLLPPITVLGVASSDFRSAEETWDLN